MPVIDADCHVIEPEHTWDYFDDSEVRFRPLTLLSPKDGRQFLAVDGRIRGGPEDFIAHLAPCGGAA